MYFFSYSHTIYCVGDGGRVPLSLVFCFLRIGPRNNLPAYITSIVPDRGLLLRSASALRLQHYNIEVAYIQRVEFELVLVFVLISTQRRGTM